MNKIPKILPESLQNYLENLQNYLEVDLYFYGSIIRDDYVPNKSDIDMCVFSDNEQSTITKLKFYLHAEEKDIKKVIVKIKKDIMYCYKLKFDIDDNPCEIYVYNNRFKNEILVDKQCPLHMSYVAKFLLHIIKFLYYTLQIISTEMYSSCKNLIMNNLVKNYESDFLVL